MLTHQQTDLEFSNEFSKCVLLPFICTLTDSVLFAHHSLNLHFYSYKTNGKKGSYLTKNTSYLCLYLLIIADN